MVISSPWPLLLMIMADKFPDENQWHLAGLSNFYTEK